MKVLKPFDLAGQKATNLADPTAEQDAVTKAYVSEISARVYNSANISVATSTFFALTFNSERWDTANIHNTGSNTSRLTAPKTGTYTICGHIRIAGNATGARTVLIRLNGGTEIGRQSLPSVTGTDVYLYILTLYQLTAGDYVELEVFQNSGGSLNVISSAAFSPEFALVLIAAS